VTRPAHHRAGHRRAGLLRTAARAPAAALLLTAALLTGTTATTAALPTAHAAPTGCGPNDPIGSRWPLLFVHGYTASAAVWNTAVARFCTPAVYATTFNYGPVSTHWVTDPAIGPALASDILALAAASKRDGGPGKVLIVGHSMGGLAIRCAADSRCNGDPTPAGQPSPVAQAIAAVITFGTPNLGTYLKGGGRSIVTDVLGPLLSAICYGDQAVFLGQNSFANGLCETWRGLTTSAAARAFTPGSKQLNTLPAQPAGIPVEAVAGKGLLGVQLFWSTVYIYNAGTFDTGDFIVSRTSAEQQQHAIGGFGGTDEINCGTATLSVTGYDQSKLTCWHGTEPTDSRFLDQVQAMIDHVTVRPVTTADLMSAPVPALRGNPAGRLVNGVLNGPGGGATQLDLTGGQAPAHGDLTGDGVGDAAAVLGSTSGVGGEDQYVELYTNKDHPLGGFNPAGATPNGYHSTIEAMIIRGGAVLLDWATQNYTNSPNPLTYWSGKLTFNGTKVVLSDLQPHTGITGSQLWSDQHLTITPTSLGQVHLGMTLTQAQAAAGVVFDGAGDGYTYPEELPAGYAHDYVGGAYGNHPVTCIGTRGSATSTQTVSTPEGVSLGDPASKVTQVYRSAAAFVPMPTGGGLDPRAGYVVKTGQGTLAFAVDSPTGPITGIAAGGPTLTPSSCTG
jgi:pimeloyl-ACP methyl ester carboxylesterase